MDEDSLKKTIPEARAIRPVILKGYKRLFNLASSGRINEETGVRACVLNIQKDSEYDIYGVLAEIPEQKLNELEKREAWYDKCSIETDLHIAATTFIAHNYEPYDYVYGDPVQDEYLQICIDAAKKYGFLDNFLDATFVGEKSLRETDLIS